MNFIDLIILIPLVWFGYKGFRNGFIMEIVAILALIAGIYISSRFSTSVGKLFGIDGEAMPLISFVLCFVAVLLLVFFIGKLVDKIVDKLNLGFFNKLFGMLFGILKMALVFGLIIFVWNKIDSSEKILKTEVRNHSLLFRPMEQLTYFVWPLLPQIGK